MKRRLHWPGRAGIALCSHKCKSPSVAPQHTIRLYDVVVHTLTPTPTCIFPARSLLPAPAQSTQTMLQQIQHKSRHNSTFTADHHYNSSNPPAFGRPNSASHQAQSQSQYSSYSPNAFADMVGSFSVPQYNHQMRSLWYSPPPAPQRYASSSRRAATFTARNPPSPTNSSYTTASSNSTSFSSQPGQSAGIGATHRPLASWTHGSNIWRKRLIGMSIATSEFPCLARNSTPRQHA